MKNKIIISTICILLNIVLVAISFQFSFDGEPVFLFTVVCIAGIVSIVLGIKMFKVSKLLAILNVSLGLFFFVGAIMPIISELS